MWNLKYGMNESTKQKQIHREQTCVCQGGGGRSGMDWEFGVVKSLHRMDREGPTGRVALGKNVMG